MTAPKDWTPEGPNCRQCGRHDYLLHLHADEIHGWAGCTTDAECPLASKPVAKFEPWTPPLKWTSEQPTGPGYYWLKFRSAKKVELVYVLNEEAHGIARALWDMDELAGELWAGPLVPPEEAP